MINADVCGIVVGVDQAGVLGRPLIYEGNVSVGRVVTLWSMSIAQHEGLEKLLTVKKSN